MSLTAHVPDDRLIDLAAGLVSPDAEPEVLGHLVSCPDCEQRFRLTCREAELARLRAPRPGARARLPWWIAAAAAVLLAVALTFYSSRNAVPLPADYWVPMGTDSVGLRSGSVDPEEATFVEAAAAYSRRDAARTVALLEGKHIPDAYDPLKIALASALVKTGRSADALATLDALRIETVPQPDRDRARWIKYAALAAEGRMDEARDVAAELASRPGDFQRAAQRLADAR